jgi:hypothetical protein
MEPLIIAEGLLRYKGGSPKAVSVFLKMKPFPGVFSPGHVA